MTEQEIKMVWNRNVRSEKMANLLDQMLHMFLIRKDTIQIMYIQNPTDADTGHFVPIVSDTNLKNLLNNGKKYICPTCKQSYVNKSCYNNHIKN